MIDELVADEIDAKELDASSVLMALNASEIDTQVSTAKRYPRSIRTFIREANEMVTLTEEIASECIYCLPRGNKPIEGPSARFAEIVATAWGNCRAGARVVSEDGRFVTAQGVFIDLQRNVAITYEVKRRITGRDGKTFSDDMIGVTSNAACSIALRNAVLKGVPKAFWNQLYQSARSTAIGSAQTLAGKRAAMLEYFAKMGATRETVFAKLEVAGEEDITLDQLALLKGIATAIKDGEISVDAAFSPDQSPVGGKVVRSKINDKLDKEPEKKPAGKKEQAESPEAPSGSIYDDESAPAEKQGSLIDGDGESYYGEGG